MSRASSKQPRRSSNASLSMPSTHAHPSGLSLAALQGPTRRELLLVLGLILLLLAYTAPSARAPDLANVHATVEGFSDLAAMGVKPLEVTTGLRWGSGAVPETQVVAQVPGACSCCSSCWGG